LNQLQELALLLGTLSTIAPITAVFLRHRSRLLLATATATGVTISAYLVILLRLLQAKGGDGATPLVYALVASAVPVLLSVYLLSASIGKENPEASLRALKRPFILLSVVGLGFLLVLRQPSFVFGYTWVNEQGTIFLGPLGKAFLSYLLIGIVFIGYNLESTYRLTASGSRHHLRLLFLAFFGLLGFFTFIITTGILYSTIGIGKLVASGMPIAFANALIAYVFLRGALTDVSTPISRNVVYSSFTALAAGLYVFAVGVVAQVATFTHWSPDEVVTLSLGFLAILIAILLLFSNRFQRRVRRFIDRNFYVNRYDYRTQWSNVTRTLDTVQREDEILQCVSSLCRDVFLADQVTISLAGPNSHEIRPRLGKGVGDPNAVLTSDTPLWDRVLRERSSLLLDRRPDDFEYIPIYAENRIWLETTAGRLLCPLFDGSTLLGVIGLERAEKDDPFTFEDAALLESVATHIASSLRSARLAAEVAESREMELLSQWSNMLVHDFKNYLTPLRMISQNILKHRDRPDIAEIAAADINAVVDTMQSLVQTLSGLRETQQLAREAVPIDDLLNDVLQDMQIERRGSIRLLKELDGGGLVEGDSSMLRRVFENLITNAVEAMEGSGTLTLRSGSAVSSGNGSSSLRVSVIDTGPGMTEEFIRNRLFRPFATTKKHGSGLGLYQCRAIVRAHHGDLLVESRPGRGTTFHVLLPAALPSEKKAALATVSTS